MAARKRPLAFQGDVEPLDGASASAGPRSLDDDPAFEQWKARERELNGSALCRGCISLWICLFIGFSPAIWALGASLILLAGDRTGLTPLASQPLSASTALSRESGLYGAVSPLELQSLRQEAAEFAHSHPGVVIVSGPSRKPRKAALVSGRGRKGAAWQASNAPPHNQPARSTASDSAVDWSGGRSPYTARNDAAHRGVFADEDYEVLGVTSLDSRAVVPRLVHQTWKDEHVPAKWLTSHRSWQASYGEAEPFTLLLWSDAALRDFLQRFFPWFLPTYDGYGTHIQRVDAARYFILYAMGGIYADLDVSFRENRYWSQLLRAEMTLPLTAPLGVSNDVMAAAPNHPFFAHLCRRLASPLAASRWLYTRFFTVMFSTGPSFVSVQLLCYRAQRTALGLPAEALAVTAPPSSNHAGHQARAEPSLLFLSDELYGGGHRSLVGHLDGRSWHDASTAFLWSLYSALPDAVALPGVIVIITAIITTIVVLVVMAIGWGACSQRREARALTCCLNKTLRFTICLGQPSRPTLCPWAIEPMANPPDNPPPPRRHGSAAAADSGKRDA